MLSNSDVDLTKVIEALASEGVEAGYLVPTQTGLEKSIMDAHQHLRTYLKDKNLHNFDAQAKGPEAKVVKDCLILGDRGWIPSKVSLYRPNTKNGDPRIWISDLKKHSQPHNLLVMLVVEEVLHIVNASRSQWGTLSDPSSYLAKLISTASRSRSGSESELLDLLTDIWSRGFIHSTTNADNGVGDTLENLLGIKRNASKSPDFKGIELKATRKQSKNQVSRNRSTLFSLVPDWARSECHTKEDIVAKYGYLNAEGKRALQVTLGNKPNAQGLYLATSKSERDIENLAKLEEEEKSVVVWGLEDLQSALAAKHPSTFWVKAEARKTGPVEEFHYQNVTITSRPLIQNFGPLVDAGKIQMDYTFSEKQRANGTPYIRDHGYLWKIRPKDFHLIFPSPKTLDLGQ
jgi:hypothetical protein